MKTERVFRAELRRAAEMLRADVGTSDDPYYYDYWSSYGRGLRKSFYGEVFGTDEEHELHMSLASKVDGKSRARGRGYRDGFGFFDSKGKVGRPSAGACMLSPVKVPRSLRMALIAKSKELNLGLAETRRMAYQLLTKHTRGGGRNA